MIFIDMGNLLLENKKRRNVIRTLVRDIISVFKSEDEGEYYLPNYLDNEDFYNFLDFNHDLTIELNLVEDESLDSFKLDAWLWGNEDVIEVVITYNPNTKNNITFKLIGELNEVIGHEIRHIDQKYRNLFDINVPEEEDPYKYYTQPHEIDAQVFGFKRLSKLTKRPFEVVVKEWFDTHEDVHKLSVDEVNDVISKLLNYKK
jgi:hypothetical protein